MMQWMKSSACAGCFMISVLLWNAPSPAETGIRAYGELDPAFGKGGMVGIDFGGGDGEAHGMALQDDGLIVLAGS